MKENGLEEDESILITREIHAGGKSVCRINGNLVSVSFLNKLCKKIADIHGQYDHQSLLNPENHIKLVDGFDASTINPIKEKVKDLYFNYTNTKNKRNHLIQNQVEMQRKRDFMRFELDEITKAKPLLGEDDELAERLLLLQNSEAIFEKLATTYDLLYEQAPSCHDSLGKSVQLLREIQAFSQEMNALSEAMSDCYYKLEDLRSEIRSARDSISFSPDLLNETAERIDLLTRLKRKYGGSIEKVLAYQEEIETQLNQIEDADQLLETLTKSLSHYEEALSSACGQLTILRKQSAASIEIQINNELKELNFNDASLTVSIEELAGTNGPALH
jgi:DNA repair protein RecN (Recombination protein N)